MEKGGNMKRVFERFCRGLKQVPMATVDAADLLVRFKRTMYQ